MKRKIILLGLCAILLSMPAMSAFSVNNISEKEKITQSPILPDYDGTWIGGLGVVTKNGEEWEFEAHGYLGGVYQNKNRCTILAGNTYNLDEEQTGSIMLIKFRAIVIGRISDLDGNKAPVIGFLMTNEDNLFIGRLMSIFGPAPHIWGQFTPNE